MRILLLLLLTAVSVTRVRLSSSSFCPDSCVVCTNDAIICSKLSMIIEAPDSTKALMLTDGFIANLDRIAFSDSSNMSVLVLSNNVISTIPGHAFQNLTALRSLSLDHNLLSSLSVDRSTFSWLRKLETLHLGHNAIKEIRASWFQKTDSLKTLLLEGNLLTCLDSSTFALSDLRSLETLDLSDNLISYVGRDSFRNLPRLGSLDLSRNRLQNAPDAFSYLSRLSALNLDLNHWNCSCELRELSRFLNIYIQAPDKVLYNGKRMACTSSDNPEVQTVLEINEANCLPAIGNLTADATSSITSQRYVRDVTVAVFCSCLGAVVITLAILALVYRKLRRRFKPTEEIKGAEVPSSQTWDFSEGKEALSMSYALHNSNYRRHPQWDMEETSSDSRPDTTRNHFTCQNCGVTSRRRPIRGISPNMEEDWSNYLDGWKDTFPKIKDEDGSPQRQRAPRKNTVRMQQVALRRHMSIAQREAFTPEERRNSLKNRCSVKHQHKGAYGVPPAHHHHPLIYTDDIQDNVSRNQEERLLPRSSKVIVYRDTFNYNQSNMEHQDGTQTRVQRSVTFDLSLERALYVSRKEGPYKISRTKMARTFGPKSKKSPGKGSDKGTTESRNSNEPISQRKLKVKLKLKPFRRSQVYPKSGSDAKDVKRKTREDKSHKSRTKKQSDGHEKSLGKISECEQRSSDPSETPEESCGPPVQTSNLFAEKVPPLGTSEIPPLGTSEIPPLGTSEIPPLGTSEIPPLGTTSTTDHSRIPTLDLNLALVSGAPEEDSLQKEFRTPQDGEVLPNDFMTPVSSTVSVLQEYLSSGDGSPKRKIRLIVPEKTSNRPQTALERKIR